jgi:SMC interacting uncharacterized protein involved in chromosome segregation
MVAEYSKILKSVKESLAASTVTSTGESWESYAKGMRDTIHAHYNTIGNLSDVLESYENEIKKLQDRNDKLEDIILTKIIAHS